MQLGDLQFEMKVYAVAHRGYPEKFPENTLRSFQAAMELGFSHLELDVQLSKDGIPVVMHDATTQRMTKVKAKVSDLTLAELKQLTVMKTDTIPTLEEALTLVKGKMVVDIEMKQYGGIVNGLEQAVYDVIQKLDMTDQVFVTSFDHLLIMNMRRIAPQLELGLIVYRVTPALIHFMKQIDAKYIAVKHTYLTSQLIDWCKAEGIQLIAWTVDNPREMKRIAELSPSVWVCTNRLESWIDVQKQIAARQ